MINYHNIVRALNYYTSLGYKHIEAPWLADLDTVMITCPPGRTVYPLANDGFLVASAEQGFLQLIKDKKIAPGKYISVGPCFRDDTLDELHQRYFLKAELIDIPSPQGQIKDLHKYLSSLNTMLKEATSFFKEQIFELELVDTTQETGHSSYDIKTKNGQIELGSYGLRYHRDVGFWVYGTAIAEPRFSFAAEKTKL